jgi:exopolysaccharide biosynthesis WecB/TagA/CpsF family protein
MIDRGKQVLLGVRIDAVDYAAATARIVEAAEDGRPYGVSALAVHGVMEGVADGELRYRLNRLDLVTADGQPVRWALNLLHGTELPERCYGPTLTLHVCEAAAARGLPVFLYGSRPEVLAALEENLVARFPGLVVAGSAPSVFGRVDPEELDAIGARIRASGARLVLAGLGCPRQEVFAYEMRHRTSMPVLAVGAAFDYHAGLLEEPPGWVQRAGLQWLWRLVQEPRRLFRRYLTTNPAFVARVALQRAGRPVSDPATDPEPAAELGYA